MLKRVFTAEKINEVVNHPDVYPWVHGPVTGELDLTSVAQNKANVCLWGDHGGVIFAQHQPGLYEVHTQCLKGGRGKWMLSAFHEALAWLFTHTDAVEVITRVPHGNIGAKALARRGGFQFEFDREKGWVKDHVLIPAGMYSLKVQDWMRTAPGLRTKGQEFHAQLETEYKAMGRIEPSHPEDPIHDQYVGATMEMVRGGQPYKAVILYNRWAKMAGYQEISILKAEPVIMDIVDSILMIRGNDLKVVSCRLQ